MLIFIVDDEEGLRKSLVELFRADHDVLDFDNGTAALRELEVVCPDLVITDYTMPKMSGFELIEKGRAISPSTSFLMMTAHGSVDHAIRAIRVGADDYVLKPFDIEDVIHRVKRIDDLRAWKNETALKGEGDVALARLIGSSPSMVKAREFAQKAAAASSPVLISGPSGSGKELLAHAVHETSPRGRRPFVVVNCASLSEQLVESDLFGHKRGAFTGAVENRRGRFELANGGTIFLDEIGEFPFPLQPKLLRALQEKCFYPVGGERQIRMNVRVIAATKHDLAALVKEGKFREDLFFRLNVLHTELPPLSRRTEDIPLLVEAFWASLTSETGRSIALPEEIRNCLYCYPYPGNVRELQNTLERLAVMRSHSGELTMDSLPPEVAAYAERSAHVSRQPSLDRDGLAAVIDHMEGKYVIEAMDRAGHSQAKAAALLKLSPNTLQYKLKKYGYQPPPSRKKQAA